MSTARIRRAGSALAAAAVALVVASAAQAATPTLTVGSPLVGTFISSPIALDPVTYATYVLPEPGAHVVSPVNGTVVAWRVIDASGGPFRLRVLRASPPAGIGIATSNPQSPSGPGIQTFPTNLPIEAGDYIGIDTTNPNDALGASFVQGARWARWDPPLADGSLREPDDTGVDLELGFNAEVRPVSNDIAFGRVKHNRRKGTARLAVEVPDPGSLLLFGKGLKIMTRTATAPGEVRMPVTAKGGALRKLNRRGRKKVSAQVTFSPTGIAPGTEARKLILRKRL